MNQSNLNQNNKKEVLLPHGGIGVVEEFRETKSPYDPN
jgi:hypothetical protein